MSSLDTRVRSPVFVMLAAAAAWALAAAGFAAAEQQDSAEQTQTRIEQLIEQLGHEDYFLRQQAQAELAEFSFEAFDALDEATTHEDLEIASSARYLLGLMRVQWSTEDDPEEVRATLLGYGLLPQTEKLARIRALADLPEAAGIPALCRLIRYEQSPVLAKEAVVELLGSWPTGELPDEAMARQLREALGSSRRAAAGWVLTWLRLAEEPEAAVADWNELTEAEYTLLRRFPARTRRDIVARLTRVQAEWLRKLGRGDELLAVMDRMIALQTDDPETLADLLHWLTEQQAWDRVDVLIARFPAQFADNPLLLYAVARVQAEKGDEDRAEKTAQRALALNSGNNTEQLTEHYMVARSLWRRGLLAWAEAEFRHVIDTGPPTDAVVASAYSLLAEILHDQEKELDAAGILHDLIEASEKHVQLAALLHEDLAPIRSRMNFFFACAAAGRNDRAWQREYLDKAIEADPKDVDTLIARYGMPDQSPEYRRETLRLIKEATDLLSEEIARSPDEPAAYNQYAWLVANTEGDLDKALSYSKRSVQLVPDSGSLQDTLAHVYFARGDYEKAYKTQIKAVELEPHVRQITGKLDVFRKKWEETKQQPQ